MSTDHQQYSLENQKAVIQEYAASHGLSIGQTYSDPAKSGLTLRGRTGLCKLLQDVTQGKQRYSVILVYDVSRWGRFQDDDEAACYEFICRRAGISVRYCAETFTNDQTVSSTLMKGLKRAMASEFSRELGGQVFEAKARVAASGFWAGGRPPFGFRRYLVSSDSSCNQFLRRGERKNLRTDHVKLVPGPPKDVRCVRKIFRMARSGQMTYADMARALNRQGFCHAGRSWISTSVRNVLTNPAYIGYNVWAKTAQKMRGSTLRVPRESWIERKGSFEPIIGRKAFDHVQARIEKHRADRTWSEQRILAKMRELFRQKGEITLDLIDRIAGMPSSRTVRHRIGYRRVLEITGCDSRGRFDRSDSARSTRRIRDHLIDRIIAASAGRVTMALSPGRRKLCVDGRLAIEVLICRSIRKPNGDIRWPLHAIIRERPRPVLLCRLNATNTGIHSMYFVPNFFLFRSYHYMKERDLLLSACRYIRTPSSFYEAVQTKRIAAVHQQAIFPVIQRPR